MDAALPAGARVASAGLIIELGDESFRLKKSLETASKLGARFAIIVGENEVKADAFALKDLGTGEQVTAARGASQTNWGIRLSALGFRFSALAFGSRSPLCSLCPLW